MFNRSEIMRSAWANYRRYAIGPFDMWVFRRFLSRAWYEAKRAVWDAEQAALPKVQMSPVERLRAERDALEYSDRIDWRRHAYLTAAIANLNAAGA